MKAEAVEVSALGHSRLILLLMAQQFLTLTADVVAWMLAITEAGVEPKAADENITQLKQMAVVRVLPNLKILVVVTVLRDQHGTIHK